MRRTTAGADERGFTLVELLVTMVIIGILAGIAIPVFLRQREKGMDSQARSDVYNVALAEESYFVDHDHYATQISTAAVPNPPAADTVYYRNSPDVDMASLVLVSDDGSAVTTDTDKAFCVEVQSHSGAWFSYNKGTGGMRPKGDRCPT